LKYELYEFHENPDYTKYQKYEVHENSGMEICREHTGFPRSRSSLPSLRHPKEKRGEGFDCKIGNTSSFKKNPLDLHRTSRFYSSSREVVTTGHITPFSMLSHLLI
jgi:hypothetical protein